MIAFHKFPISKNPKKMKKSEGKIQRKKKKSEREKSRKNPTNKSEAAAFMTKFNLEAS